MAKGIADLHKIRLHASSPGLGKGSTMAMDIPVAQRLQSTPVTRRLSRYSLSSRVGLRNRVMPLSTTEEDEGFEMPDYTSITTQDERLV